MPRRKVVVAFAKIHVGIIIRIGMSFWSERVGYGRGLSWMASYLLWHQDECRWGEQFQKWCLEDFIVLLFERQPTNSARVDDKEAEKINGVHVLSPAAPSDLHNIPLFFNQKFSFNVSAHTRNRKFNEVILQSSHTKILLSSWIYYRFMGQVWESKQIWKSLVSVIRWERNLNSLKSLAWSLFMERTLYFASRQQGISDPPS